MNPDADVPARDKPLARYVEKRAFDRTPEPRAIVPVSRTGPLGFVVQLHRARREHYDFRLEVDGVLKSWAMPNGLPTGPGEKRLAVQTEDHPIDYAGFEGTIPRGEYGAGAVIVWDCGVYSPLALGADGLADREAANAAVREGLRSGSLKLRLRGTKVKGAYALVRTKECWLVVRHADQGVLQLPEGGARSALSGRALAEVNGARTDGDPPFPVGPTEVIPRTLAPMLATTARAPATRAGWRYEPKLDGWRALAFVESGRVSLRSRNGEELAARFPAIASALAAQDADLVLDGELVALDAEGRPSFAALQKLALARDAAPDDAPVLFVAFDLLHLAGMNLRRLPWRLRRRALEQVLLPDPRLQTTIVGDDARLMFRAAVGAGHEGIVAKRVDAQYLPGQRSDAWQKVKPTPTSEFVIAGYTRTPRGIGALLLGEWVDDELRYVGSVGTGLERAGRDLQARLDALHAREVPFARRPNVRRSIVWLRPELVAEVTFRERTSGGRLREPAFQRLRDDLTLHAVRTGRGPAGARTPSSLVGDVVAQLDRARDGTVLSVGNERITLTHLEREYWPRTERAPAITKRGLLRYLARVSPLMLPHLAHRPVTAIRLPAGLGGERFFQKHWTDRVPEFAESITVWSEHRGDAGDYLLCNNLPTLLWLGQNAALEFHVWHSRAWASRDAARAGEDYGSSAAALEASVLNRPDWLVFDLDPYLYSGREAPGEEPELHARGFAATKRVAFALRDVLLAMGFTPYVKLSGKTGLHVFVAIERTLTFEVARELVGEVGRHLLSLQRDAVTMEWSVAKRTGKVFFDHNMNVRGKTLPVAYSPRAVPGAPLSWPLTWDSLEHAVPDDFRIDTVGDPVAHGDAWATVLTDKQNVQRTLGLGEEH